MTLGDPTQGEEGGRGPVPEQQLEQSIDAGIDTARKCVPSVAWRDVLERAHLEVFFQIHGEKMLHAPIDSGAVLRRVRSLGQWSALHEAVGVAL